VVESLTPNYSPRQHPTPKANQEHKPELEIAPKGPAEVIVGQAFNRMTKILQTLSKRRALKGEDAALERFLKFQPPTFFSKAEQDQKVEQWTEQMEAIF
jgi:hypothetical protein